jgi:uncharacterized membrane protein
MTSTESTPNTALLKTATFAILHFGVAFSVAYALTGSPAVALGVGLIEPLLNTVVFYFHERTWRRFDRRGSGIARPTAPCCAIVRQD